MLKDGGTPCWHGRRAARKGNAPRTLRAWRHTRGKWRVSWLALPALLTAAVFVFGTTRGDCASMLRDASCLIGGVTVVSAVLGVWAVRRGIPLP